MNLMLQKRNDPCRKAWANEPRPIQGRRVCTREKNRVITRCNVMSYK